MKRSPASAFTLIEIVAAMTVILILTSLVISIAGYVMSKANHTRAKDEVKLLEMCLRSYFADYRCFPTEADQPGLQARQDFIASKVEYAQANLALYRALTGDWQGSAPNSEPDGVTDDDGKAYWEPRNPGMIKTERDANGRILRVLYIQDPWGDAYGYSTAAMYTAAAASGGFNICFPDLWSTGNTHPSVQPTSEAEKEKLWARWIKNW